MELEVVALTRELVRLPTVLGNELSLNQHLLEILERSPFDEVVIDDWGNLAAVLHGTHAGSTILLDAHVDTVDVEPESEWTHPPFEAHLEDGKVWGRGTSDMKGALAAMLCGVARLHRDTLHGSVVISASVGEELVEGAALAHVLDQYPAQAVIIGEASSLNVVTGGRGRVEMVVRTSGRPSHASRPDLGVHAVHAMSAVNQAFLRLPMPQRSVGTGAVCLTDIISEPYPSHSVVPSGCRATWERRLVPGETLDEVLRQHRNAATAALADHEAMVTVRIADTDYTTPTGILCQQPKWFPPWEADNDDPVVKTVLRALQSIGQRPRTSAYQFCTNATYSAGIASIPTIGYGPSHEHLAHIVDEYVEVEQLRQAEAGYHAIVQAFLGPSASA